MAFSSTNSHLKILLRFLVELNGFGLGQQFALVRQILRGQLAHFCFDFRQILGSERLFAQEFVEEAIVHRRPDPQLHIRKKLSHRGGEKMRGRVPEDVTARPDLSR